MPLTEKNHYVPCLYLKYFADEAGFVQHYRILVSRSSIPEWKRVRPAGVGYQQHIYTRTLPEGESDEIEQWLSRDFETPVQETLRKIANGEQLRKDDYRLLTRFVVAQSVRTPAFLVENLPRWREEAEQQLKGSAQRARDKLMKGELGNASDYPPIPEAKFYPLKITREYPDDSQQAIVKVRTVVGRGTWLFAMKHLLTNTINKLTYHKWTVIHSHDDLPWFTSDDPVIRLNFRNYNDYNFGGGWGVQHTNILLPLSPRHLLYTQVGDKRLPNGTTLPREHSIFLRKIIAEHAHRHIFSMTIEADIERFRRRHVSEEDFRREQEEWSKWHAEQSAAERELLS